MSFLKNVSRARFHSLPLALLGVALTSTACESSVPDAGAALPSSAAVATQVDTRFEQERTQDAPEALRTAAGQLADSRQTAIVRAAERVFPGVVTISIITTQQVQTFFGTRQQRGGGYGSGFVIDAEAGIIMTNNHVIQGAERMQVTLSDGTDLEAELVGTDEVTDVAVLRITTPHPLTQVPLGTSSDLLIGEWAIAVGNPFGVEVSNSEPTVTTGVVSATGRHLVPSQGDESFYLGMIQTDAAINPGNSGGPLVNVLGQVIGVNSSIFSRSGGSEGLGFAIPIDRALRVAEDLISLGQVRRAWLGLQVDAAASDEWGRARGVMITEVFEDSPAIEAGIPAQRRILSANGRRLSGPLDWEDVILDLREGDPLDLEIEGEGNVRLVTAPYPSTQAMRVQVVDDLDVISVTPQIRGERDLAIDRGALVVGITDELRRITGLQEEDVIFRMRTNRSNLEILTAEDLADAFRTMERQGRSVQFQLIYARGNQQRQTTLTFTGRGDQNPAPDPHP